MNTEDIFWKAIRDIEEGNVFTIEEDPINGFLTGKNKKLTKKNVCDQTAKYNQGKSFSRPTLDSYSEIANYITKSKPSNNIENLKEREKDLLIKINSMQELIKQLQEDKSNLAFENYQLQEKVKFLEDK